MNVLEEGNVNHEMNHAQYMEIDEIQSFELKRDDIKFERLLGRGNFGEVYKATWVTTKWLWNLLKVRITKIC